MNYASYFGQEEAEILQLLSAHLESVMEETMDLKGIMLNEVDGSQQMQTIRGVYRVWNMSWICFRKPG